MLLSMIFACTLGVGLYGLIDHKMHSQPWRMLAVALVAIVLGAGLMAAFDALGSFTRGLESLGVTSALFNAVASSMGGALIGAAVSNKASILHRKELRRLEDQIEHFRSILVRIEATAEEPRDPLRDGQLDRATQVAELGRILNALERERRSLG